MIVKMKKASIVTLDSYREENIKALGKLGLLHINTEKPDNQEYRQLIDWKQTIERSLLLLPNEKDKKKKEKPDAGTKISIPTSLEYAKRIIQRNEELKKKEDEARKLEQYIKDISIWGNYEPKDLFLLEASGLDIKLIVVKKKELPKDADLKNFFIIQETRQNIYAAVIGECGLNAFREYEPPEKSLALYKADMKEIEKNIKKINGELDSLIRHRSFLSDAIKKLNQDLEFYSVYFSVEEHEELSVITGFIPEPDCLKVSDFAKKHSWALLISDVDRDDKVPTLVKNPKAISIIKPIFSFIGTVPGYRENDISFMFLSFFSLFFAMIIGDAGYGAIIFLFSFAILLKNLIRKKPVPDMIFLLTLMGFTTLVWGSLTGTWFGSDKISVLPGFKNFIINSLYSHNPDSEGNIKLLCFIIGAIHLSIAHSWNIIGEIKRKTGIKVLAQFGWLSMVIGLFFLVLNLVLSAEEYPLPSFALPLILGGFAAVFIFSNQEGNFIKGILKSLAGIINITLSGISVFSDIISYIRLFAVGLASVEIAKSFNQMAEGTGNSLFGIIGGAFILILGHTLNMAMGALSVIVHGVRLNMLEFSGHLGMEWTGMEYKPFCVNTD